MFKQKRLCGYGAYTTWAEQLRDGDQQVDGEDQDFAHGANRSMTASARKTAPHRRIPPYYEFATHRLSDGKGRPRRSFSIRFDTATAMSDTIRVIVAKVGLDGHDRGVKIVARTLRDAGMEVIYTGLHRTPEEVVDAAVQEDVDVLGISILSGAHMTIFPRVLQLLKERDAEDIIVLGGGVMPDGEVAELKAMGVKEILLQDTPPETIVATIRRLVAERGPK
jgi:methylmalonyl-CoA mutase cobalamin-binding domain/chain